MAIEDRVLCRSDSFRGTTTNVVVMMEYPDAGHLPPMAADESACYNYKHDQFITLWPPVITHVTNSMPAHTDIAVNYLTPISLS